MQAIEFLEFKRRLKAKKITQKALSKWCGYTQCSLIQFAKGKEKLPMCLIRAIEGILFKEQSGIDLKNIIK